MTTMKCTVSVTWADKTKKNKKTAYPCDKYFVKEGVLALETREVDGNGDLLKVKTLGIPMNTITTYEAIYEKVVSIEENAVEGT